MDITSQVERDGDNEQRCTLALHVLQETVALSGMGSGVLHYPFKKQSWQCRGNALVFIIQEFDLFSGFFSGFKLSM